MSADADRGGDDAVVRPAEPPAPDAVFRVVNPLLKLLLHSPLHGLISDDLMLVTFEGRRSGREYTTPVGYRQEGDVLWVLTHSDWWKNLRGGRPVTLRLRGERREGVATPHPEPEVVARRVQQYVEEHGVESARRVGVEIRADRPPDFETLRDGVEGTVAIEIALAD